MNEEKQLEFLNQNIKVDSDFKQFFRDERKKVYKRIN